MLSSLNIETSCSTGSASESDMDSSESSEAWLELSLALGS